MENDGVRFIHDAIESMDSCGMIGELLDYIQMNYQESQKLNLSQNASVLLAPCIQFSEDAVSHISIDSLNSRS